MQKLHRSVVLTTSFSPAVHATPKPLTPRPQRTPMSVYKSALSTPYAEDDAQQYVSDFDISAVSSKTPVRNIACVSYVNLDASTPLVRTPATSLDTQRSARKPPVGALHMSAIKNNLRMTPRQTPKITPRSERIRLDAPSPASSAKKGPLNVTTPSIAAQTGLTPATRSTPVRTPFSGRKGAPPSSLATPKLCGKSII